MEVVTVDALLAPAARAPRRLVENQRRMPCGPFYGLLRNQYVERNDRTLHQCSGMTLGPTARDETTCNSDDSTADGIEGNHTCQQQRQDDGGSATFPVALSTYEHDFRDAEESCDGEERSAGL
jgi:hypothetical protein